MKPEFECSCYSCKGACTYTPGWFLPGEAEEAAIYLDIPMNKLFNEKLGVNWWCGNDEVGDIFLLAPATLNMSTGKEYPGDPRGLCVFYKNEECEIHPAKPFECAMYRCNPSKTEIQERHKEVSIAWKIHQKQIVDLLGREPLADDSFASMFSLLFDSRR